jgi:hypothetical protein
MSPSSLWRGTVDRHSTRKLFAHFLITFLVFSQAGTEAFAPVGPNGLSGEPPSVLLLVKKKHKPDGNGDSSSSGDGTPSGEHSCPEGYVVLKEKNKYGAFCEPKEGSVRRA